MWSIVMNTEPHRRGFYNTEQDIVIKSGAYIMTALCQVPIKTVHVLLDSSSPRHLWSKDSDYDHFVD